MLPMTARRRVGAAPPAWKAAGVASWYTTGRVVSRPGGDDAPRRNTSAGDAKAIVCKAPLTGTGTCELTSMRPVTAMDWRFDDAVSRLASARTLVMRMVA